MDTFDPGDPFKVAYAEKWACDVHLELRRAARKRYRQRAKLLRPRRMARGFAALASTEMHAESLQDVNEARNERDAYVSKLRPSKRRPFWKAYRAEQKVLRQF